VEPPWPKAVAKGLELLMEPREAQVPAFAEWLKAGHGILKAAPAFGKTFVMIKLIMTLKQYTMVLVHTDALAEQFITRFRHGSPSRDDEIDFDPVTNCLELEEKLGRPIIGRYRTPDELFPVTVATWQSFISKSGRLNLKKVGKKFGLVLCDEAHVFAAPKAAGVVNGFHAKRRSGATATPQRKDKLDVALYDIVGPVTATGRAGQLPITATLITTGIKYKGSSFSRKSEWAHLLNFICKQADRNDLITDWVVHDVEQGRNLLLLSDRVQWCLDHAEFITRELGIPAAAVTGGMSSKKGIEKRNKIIQQMTDGDIRVICATQVFKAGVDIPPLDTLYATCPMNNAPQLRQMLGRIRRAYEGKQTPTLRYFVDEGHGLLYGCARGTHKALVAEGADIILIPEGRKPGQRTSLASDSDGKLGRRKKKGLRAAAAQSPSGVSQLFADLTDEAKQTKRYNKRMGK